MDDFLDCRGFLSDKRWHCGSIDRKFNELRFKIIWKQTEFVFQHHHSFGKIAPFVHLQEFFSKTASRAVINVKFEQKSASRAEVKHKNGLKTILFRKILGRTHFKHVFRNYAPGQFRVLALNHREGPFLCLEPCILTRFSTSFFETF